VLRSTAVTTAMGTVFRTSLRFRDIRLRREVFENCALVGYYVASSSSFVEELVYGLFLFYLKKVGPIGCPETSIRNDHYSVRNISNERSSLHYVCNGY